MKKVRWGVIGAGGIAQRRTIPGMMQCENAELVAVMEITPELTESCRAKWNCKKAYTSAEELLNDPEIDAVYIASPVFLHAQQAMAAADAGKHILIEKPLAMTAAEGQKVVEHCKEKGVLIAAGFMMRFGACIQAMKKAIDRQARLCLRAVYLLVPGYSRRVAAEKDAGRRRRAGGHGRALHRSAAICAWQSGCGGRGHARHADVPL